MTVFNIAVGIWILAIRTSCSLQENNVITGSDILLLLNKLNLQSGSTLILVQDVPLNLTQSILLEQWMTDKELKLMTFQFDSLEVSLPTMLSGVIQSQSPDYYRSVLNVVAFCQENCLRIFLQMLSKADFLHGRRSLLRHFAKVLVVLTKELNEQLWDSDTQLDNLAIAFKRTGLAGEICLRTLLWKNEGRSWAPVGFSPSDNPPTDLFPNTKYGLNGRILTVAALEWMNYCKADTYTDDGSVTFTHICKELADYLATALNFTYMFVQPIDKIWGQKLSNSTWTGLLGMISTNEADFSIVPFGRTVKRQEAISFSSSMMTSTYRCAYLKEFSNRNDWVALVSCFKWEVYVCGFLTAIWCVFLTLVLEKATRKTNQTTPLKDQQFHKIIDTLSVALHKGTVNQPNTSSQRILLAAWWVFCIIMATVYTGNLTAFLTISKEVLPFRTLGELVDNKEYTVVVSRGSFMEEQIEESKTVIMRKLWSKILENRKYTFESSSDERQYMEDMLLAGKSAWLALKEDIEYIEERVSPVGRMQGDLLTIHMGLPFPLNSPLEPLVSQMLAVAYDSGVIDGLGKKWLTSRPVIDSEKSVSQLKMNDFKSALTACTVGVFLSFVCLAVEKVWIIK